MVMLVFGGVVLVVGFGGFGGSGWFVLVAVVVFGSVSVGGVVFVG